MDTKPLERFATWARRELLSVVDAQASTVLANGSVPRTEHPDAVRRLESEIENHGRQHIIDKVAYTWFNRIIALRFMDVRGYTDVGVVSPPQGQEQGQPEILTDAKRGNLDPEVITSKRTTDAILGLINGTRHSTNEDAEVYALLLTEYCRYWHRSMPFMFEREGDYTELLVPANLLAEGAILSRTREVLTEEVCEDVEVIGWLYQFYISERKDEVFAGFKQNKKAGADEIPAATQLFTPHWIVRYLVENSVGRLWMLNHPESRLIDQMEYYITPVDEETDFLKISGPEGLTVIDPACGSGHMLTYAFDLLYAIYEEAGYAPLDIPGLILSHNLHGTEIDPRAGALAAFALTMKARAKQRTFFNRQIGPKICIIEPISFRSDELEVLAAGQGDDVADEEFFNQFEHADTFGSLIQPDALQTMHLKTGLKKTNIEGDILYAHTMDRACRLVSQAEMLSDRYAVVVANPPYMGSKNMNARLAEFVKTNFPDGKQDLYGSFVLRSMNMALPGGFVAKIIGDTWMSIVSFKDFREDILAGHSFDSFIHLRDVSNHPDVFGANTAFALSMTDTPGKRAPFIRLTPLNDEEKRLRLIEALSNSKCDWRFAASSEDFAKIPASPIAYWVTPEILEKFSSPALSQVFYSGGRLKTHGNQQYVRYFWEISNNKCRWNPLANGGGYSPFAGNDTDYVNWSDRAVDAYSGHGGLPSVGAKDKVGITWNLITSARTSFRLKGEGELFSSASPTVFPSSTDVDLFAYLAYLNSDVIYSMLQVLNPTMNTVVGDILRLPQILDGARDKLSVLGQSSMQLVQELRRREETSPHFESVAELVQSDEHCILKNLMIESVSARKQTSASIRERITEANRVILNSWNLQGEYDEAENVHTEPVEDLTDRTRALISYAVGCMFGRFSLDEPGLILANHGTTLQDYLAKVPSPALAPDADNVIPFVDDGWFEDDIVERFRKFLRVAFGDEHFEENLRFIEGSLGVKTLRDYFITKNGKSKFYDDHVQLYKKRPIYWLFSSSKGSFNALIYIHRYTPSTVSTVLNEYLREYRAKLEVALTDAEKAATEGSSKEQKEADRLRRVLLELEEYEHDVLYPLATRQLPMDLDDGVLVNYLRFGSALKNIGLETHRKKVEGWDWPTNKLEPLS